MEAQANLHHGYDYKRCDTCDFSWLRSFGGRGGKSNQEQACRHPSNLLRSEKEPGVLISKKVDPHNRRVELCS